MSEWPSDPEDVYDAIIDAGKQGRVELAAGIAPFLTSPTGFLRDAAMRTLTFHFGLPEYKETAVRAVSRDPDPDVREAAAMGLGRFAREDHGVLAKLVHVAQTRGEEDSVRAAAFLAALVAAGIEADEFPHDPVIPDFERRADWALLARVLDRAGLVTGPALLGVNLLYEMCAQVCRTASVDARAVATAAGLSAPLVEDGPDIALVIPPPAYAGRVTVATWKDEFTDVRIALSSTGPTLAELEQRFGPAQWVPTSPHGTARAHYF